MRRLNSNRTIIVICLIGILLYVILPSLIFGVCLFIENTGKMKSYEEISNYVIQNKLSLTEEVIHLLETDDEMDISIDGSEITDWINEKEMPNFEGKSIIGLSKKEYIEKMKIYKDENTEIVLFISDSAGIVGSSSFVGFYYFNDKEDRTIYECMNELKNKGVMNWYYLDYFNNIKIKEIIPNWFFFETI